VIDYVIRSTEIRCRGLGRSSFAMDLSLAAMSACPECVTHCYEPSCTAAGMTSQCTDQCIVITCTDQTHAESSYHASLPCDASCDSIDKCPDTTGYEDVVRRFFPLLNRLSHHP
jgi:hypothetical protein